MKKKLTRKVLKDILCGEYDRVLGNEPFWIYENHRVLGVGSLPLPLKAGKPDICVGLDADASRACHNGISFPPLYLYLYLCLYLFLYFYICICICIILQIFCSCGMIVLVVRWWWALMHMHVYLYLFQF